jgi:hypothetical protein
MGMTGQGTTIDTLELGGFPPGRAFLLIPRRPRRAAISSLALYEAVEPRQRAVLAGARMGIGIGLGRLLRPPDGPPQSLDPNWWESFCHVVAAPVVGRVGLCSFRIPPNGRTAALLMDDAGRPIGFAKQLTRPPPELVSRITRAMARPDLPFATPTTLAEGSFEGSLFRLSTPLPEGPHRRPPHRPDRVAEIVDAWQAAVREIPRPDGATGDAVVCHGDFTPRNLRVASDGRWWLIDWDSARWGPPLADELHYWCAEYGWRFRPRPRRHARRVLRLLRRRGSDRQIMEAALWPDAPPRVYRASEHRLRAEVARLARREN